MKWTLDRATNTKAVHPFGRVLGLPGQFWCYPRRCRHRWRNIPPGLARVPSFLLGSRRLDPACTMGQSGAVHTRICDERLDVWRRRFAVNSLKQHTKTFVSAAINQLEVQEVASMYILGWCVYTTARLCSLSIALNLARSTFVACLQRPHQGKKPPSFPFI